MLLEVGKRFKLKNSLRVYKKTLANRTLRGSDIKAIGEGHALQDNPLMINRFVRILEESNHRVKVTGSAFAELEGTAHRVVEWIEKDGVT